MTCEENVIVTKSRKDNVLKSEIDIVGKKIRIKIANHSKSKKYNRKLI